MTRRPIILARKAARLALLAPLLIVCEGRPLGASEPPWVPQAGKSGRFRLQGSAIEDVLARAPRERTAAAASRQTASVTLPMPDGTFESFSIGESPIMAPGLAARYPRIRSYVLRGVSRPWRGRLTRGPRGLHALIRTDGGPVLLRPAPEEGEHVYASVFDAAAPLGGSCQTVEPAPALATAAAQVLSDGKLAKAPAALNPSGDTLRIYRLAVATTGEYYAGRGGTDELVLDSIVTEISKVNVIYESEVAISLVLVDETDQLFFTDPDTDGYTNSVPCTMWGENQAIIDGILDDGDYDIGHVFGTSPGGGCASGSVVCVSGSKARGASGINVGLAVGHENFGGYRLVAHEMGHQFSASHTFSGSQGNCSAAQWASSTSYEPGSGTTLMSYSGTCVTDNIQGVVEDTYLHTATFDQIVAFATTGAGDTCPLKIGTGNSPPVVDAGPDYTIPSQTPFVLTGSADDADGGVPTFTWEQFDLAPAQGPPNVDDGVGPLFRSFPPALTPERTFPQLSDILANTTTVGELLPQGDRTLTFRLTARDNNAAAGGVNHDTMVVTVAGDPFRITSPDGGEVLAAGCPAPVTWQVGGGSVADSVDLSFSGDGGQTFVALADAAANDGAHSVSLPCASTNDARVKAQAVANIFFDVSDADFDVSAVPPSIAADATGGGVDAACQLVVPFEASVEDDCAVDADAVTVEATVLTGNASLGTPSLNAAQVDATTVTVTGSVLVYDLESSPAVVRVTVRAPDACGLQGTDTVDVNVVDLIPPSLSVGVSPSVLWPPNHELVGVSVSAAASDNCPGVGYVLTSVASSEPENGAGDGDTAPDVAGAVTGTPDLTFELRAERRGGGPGRTYTATYTATDGSGNQAEAAAQVLVPKNQKPQ